MSSNIIDGALFKELVKNGAANLCANYQSVDALNVFPVPDGDTGTNMRMTIEAGVNEIQNSDEKSIYLMAKKLSRGMLMGARGNSGVILSQLFRGIYKGLEEFETVNVKQFAKAFKSGVTQAYHAVLKPVEGTILTVAREASDKAYKAVTKNSSLEAFFEAYLAEARASLKRTPDLLPVLKEAGVVDSGGAGYIYVLEGMQKYLKGELVATEAKSTPTQNVSRGNFNAHSVLQYGYCTEFILQLQWAKVDITNFDVKTITNYLETLGNSIVALKDEDIVKIHVHTMKPGEVLNYCQQFGEYITLKIENMSISHTETMVETNNQQANDQQTDPALCNCPECVAMRAQAAHKKFAVVAVASGAGLVQTFKEMGVDYVVEGGQSMNPSAEDFVKGFDSLNAEKILVFPNNSNIVLTAQQAAKYYEKAKVIVVPSKTLAQGYSALTMLDLSSGDDTQILEEIQDVIDNVTTGLVTYSIRDAEIEGVSIKKGDYIGIFDGKIVVSKLDRLDATKALIDAGATEEKEIITVIYGKDITKEETEQLSNWIKENHSELETDFIEGNQDVYSYILSIE
jgi:DAK2 domain fusion protein YloV